MTNLTVEHKQLSNGKETNENDMRKTQNLQIIVDQSYIRSENYVL